MHAQPSDTTTFEIRVVCRKCAGAACVSNRNADYAGFVTLDNYLRVKRIDAVVRTCVCVFRARMAVLLKNRSEPTRDGEYVNLHAYMLRNCAKNLKAISHT